jgi:hypothetical protein
MHPSVCIVQCSILAPPLLLKCSTINPIDLPLIVILLSEMGGSGCDGEKVSPVADSGGNGRLDYYVLRVQYNKNKWIVSRILLA